MPCRRRKPGPKQATKDEVGKTGRGRTTVCPRGRRCMERAERSGEHRAGSWFSCCHRGPGGLGGGRTEAGLGEGIPGTEGMKGGRLRVTAVWAGTAWGTLGSEASTVSISAESTDLKHR